MRVTQKNGLSYAGISVRLVLPSHVYDEVVTLRARLHCNDALAIQAIVNAWAVREYAIRYQQSCEAQCAEQATALVELDS
jgi:hypothetical protein